MIDQIKQIDGYETMTAAEIAAKLNTSRMVPVSHDKIKAWLSEAGLSERLRIWMRQSDPGVDADLSDANVLQILSLRAGIDGVLTMGPGTELDISPDSWPRQLLDAAVSLPTVPATEDDRDRLFARAMPATPVTAEQVQAALDDDAKEPMRQYAQSLLQRVSAAINLASEEDAASEQSIRDAATAEIG